MPANQSLGVGATRRLDTAVREIDVATGSLILTFEEKSVVVPKGERVNFDPPLAGVVAYAPDGARFHVTYETDPVDHEESRRKPGTEKPKRTQRKRSTVRTTASKSKPSAKATKRSSRKKG